MQVPYVLIWFQNNTMCLDLLQTPHHAQSIFIENRKESAGLLSIQGSRFQRLMSWSDSFEAVKQSDHTVSIWHISVRPSSFICFFFCNFVSCGLESFAYVHISDYDRWSQVLPAARKKCRLDRVWLSSESSFSAEFRRNSAKCFFKEVILYTDS